MGWQPPTRAKARIYAKYLLKKKPDAKIAVLYQNDDYGKDYLKGLKDGLGAKAASMIVAEESYETSEPTIDTHIVKLKSPAPTSSSASPRRNSPRRAIKKVAEIGWKPLHILTMSPLRSAACSSPPASKMRKASSRRPTPRTAPIRSGTTIRA